MKKTFVVLFSLLMVSCGFCIAALNSGVEIQEQRGCCSHHGGVAYCGNSGYFICADGTRSPSCRCR